MRVLLSGYYGFGNLGDEALLEVITQQIHARFPGIELEVLSATPQETERHLQLKAIDRWDTREVRKALTRADLVLSGGGGLLQNTTSLRSLLYYVGIIHQAVKADRKVMIFAQSIGPLDMFGRFIVREGCKGIARATVRDQRSKKILESLVPKARVEQTADPVFLYQSDERADLREEGLGDESGPYAIVSVRKAPGFEQGASAIAFAIDRLYQKYNVKSAFLPLGGTEDAELSTTVIRKCETGPLLLPERSLERTAAIVRGAHVVIGMRLHALIFAARFGVPFLAIPYDPKVSSLCEDLDYPLDPLWTPGKPVPEKGRIEEMIDHLVAEHDRLSAHLRERVTVLQHDAARNFEILGELLQG